MIILYAIIDTIYEKNKNKILLDDIEIIEEG